MAEITLNAETRTEFGKGAARRLRRAGQVPAVLYGHGTDPVHIALPGHATLLALRTANALLSIELPGEQAQLALPKQVQRDPIRGSVEHVDLLIVKRGEKVTVEVPVTLVGDAAPNTMVALDLTTITVLAPATAIPNEIEISIEGLEAGVQILQGEVKLPEGVEVDGDPELLVVNITNAPTQAQLDAELAEAEAGAGIEHEAPADAAEAAADEA